MTPDELRSKAAEAMAFMPWAARILEGAADEIDRLTSELARYKAVAEAAEIHVRKGGMANAQRLSDALAALKEPKA